MRSFGTEISRNWRSTTYLSPETGVYRRPGELSRELKPKWTQIEREPSKNNTCVNIYQKWVALFRPIRLISDNVRCSNDRGFARSLECTMRSLAVKRCFSYPALTKRKLSLAILSFMSVSRNLKPITKDGLQLPVYASSSVHQSFCFLLLFGSSVPPSNAIDWQTASQLNYV